MENKKNIKIALLIVTMLIITISSIVSTVLMYGLLKDITKGNQYNISTNLNNEVEEDNLLETY